MAHCHANRVCLSGSAPLLISGRNSTTKNADLPEAIGKPCPQYVFLNDRDYAYGRFLLDERSRKAVIDRLAKSPMFSTATLLWGSLWDSVREAEFAPRDYLDLALRASSRGNR